MILSIDKPKLLFPQKQKKREGGLDYSLNKEK